jgi:hypothetical protein
MRAETQTVEADLQRCLIGGYIIFQAKTFSPLFVMTLQILDCRESGKIQECFSVATMPWQSQRKKS